MYVLTFYLSFGISILIETEYKVIHFGLKKNQTYEMIARNMQIILIFFVTLVAFNFFSA